MNNFFSLSILLNRPLLLLLLLLLLPIMIIIIIIIHIIIITIIIIIIIFCLLKRSIIIYINPSNIFARTRLVLTHRVTEFFPAKTVYLPGDIPQISNLISITISFRFKFISSWESLIIVTEQGKHLLVHRAVPENTPNKTSPAVKKKLFVRSPTMQNIWKIIHTIFSIIIIIIIIIFFVYWKEALSYILIHQIFLLAHDWS